MRKLNINFLLNEELVQLAPCNVLRLYILNISVNSAEFI